MTLAGDTSEEWSSAARRQLGGPPQSEDLTEHLRAWEEVVEPEAAGGRAV